MIIFVLIVVQLLNNINSIIEYLKNEQKLFKLDDSVSKNIKDLDIKKILGDVIDNN